MLVSCWCHVGVMLVSCCVMLCHSVTLVLYHVGVVSCWYCVMLVSCWCHVYVMLVLCHVVSRCHVAVALCWCCVMSVSCRCHVGVILCHDGVVSCWCHVVSRWCCVMLVSCCVMLVLCHVVSCWCCFAAQRGRPLFCVRASQPFLHTCRTQRLFAFHIFAKLCAFITHILKTLTFTPSHAHTRVAVMLEY